MAHMCCNDTRTVKLHSVRNNSMLNIVQLRAPTSQPPMHRRSNRHTHWQWAHNQNTSLHTMASLEQWAPVRHRTSITVSRPIITTSMLVGRLCRVLNIDYHAHCAKLHCLAVYGRFSTTGHCLGRTDTINPILEHFSVPQVKSIFLDFAKKVSTTEWFKVNRTSAFWCS